MKNSTYINIKKSMFSDLDFTLLKNDNFTVTTLLYPSGIEGIKIDNGICSMAVLPYMGHQVWFLEINGENVTQESIFDYPRNTNKFGDNYGAFLIHCGLTNINGPSDDEDYPLHGELPFAEYSENYICLGNDEKGNYLSIGGKFSHLNSQDYYYEYCPELRLYENSSIVEMKSTINNKRKSKLDYLFMCHMNWLGVDGSKIHYSVKKDDKHIQVPIGDKPGDTEREIKLYNFTKKVVEDHTIVDILDIENQVYNPELCINMIYSADKDGWGHALKEKPTEDSFYVGFNTNKLSHGLRWYCITGDENGVGFCLPTTGTNHSSKYQYENGLYKTLEGNSSTVLEWKFGTLNVEETKEMKKKIDDIVRKEQ